MTHYLINNKTVIATHFDKATKVAFRKDTIHIVHIYKALQFKGIFFIANFYLFMSMLVDLCVCGGVLFVCALEHLRMSTYIQVSMEARRWLTSHRAGIILLWMPPEIDARIDLQYLKEKQVHLTTNLFPSPHFY